MLEALEKDSKSRVGLIRAALREERRLLGLAEAALRKASATAKGPERARLMFLAGDCARRGGASGEWRALLTQARDLSPDSPAGQTADQLLQGGR